MKIILNTLLILIIIATISVCIVQPDIHKNVFIYDSDYVLVSEQEVKADTKEIPVMKKTVQPVETVKKVEQDVQTMSERSFSEVISKVETQSVPKQAVNTTKKEVQPKKTEIKQTSAPKVQTVQKVVTKSETKPLTQKTEEKKVEPKKIQEIKTVTTQKVKTVQEETIAWNIWRSNLQNKIMQDTKLPNLPNGTEFQFSFTVDKSGKVSNIHTGANPSTYTPYAIQYIAPVIRSYQGKSILNFPEGTARTMTDVTGKWRISNTEKYSTPQDFNDIEKVVK